MTIPRKGRGSVKRNISLILPAGDLTCVSIKPGWGQFPSIRGKKITHDPITVSGVNQMFHRRLKAAGLPMYRVHDWRHTFTKAAMRGKKPLSSIQKQLGHASPDMVMRYAKVFSLEQAQDFSDFGDDEWCGKLAVYRRNYQSGIQLVRNSYWASETVPNLSNTKKPVLEWWLLANFAAKQNIDINQNLLFR